MKTRKTPRSLNRAHIGAAKGVGSRSMRVSQVSARTGEGGGAAPEDKARELHEDDSVASMLKDLTTREAGLLSILMPRGSPKMKGVDIYRLYCKYMPIDLSRTSVYVMLTRLVELGLIEREETTGAKTYCITRLGRETFGYYMKSQVLVVGAYVPLGTLRALVAQREKAAQSGVGSARAGE